nr:hypothetical protein [Tanacetum cinerariifolium]
GHLPLVPPPFVSAYVPVATMVVDVSLGMGEMGENIIITLWTTNRNARDADHGILSSAGVIHKRLSIPSHKGLLGGGVQVVPVGVEVGIRE